MGNVHTQDGHQPHICVFNQKTVYTYPEKIFRMINLICPVFECVECRSIKVVCMVCGDNIYSQPYGTNFREFTGLTRNEFFRHLRADHKDERYLEHQYGCIDFIRRDAGLVYTDLSSFIDNNPHVLFVTTDGFNYSNSVHKIDQECGGDFDQVCYCEERFDELVSRITEGSNSCMNCDMEYEVFPTFEEFMKHAKRCFAKAC